MVAQHIAFSEEAFRHALRRGFGRAYLWARDVRPWPFRRVLEEACLKCETLDPQPRWLPRFGAAGAGGVRGCVGGRAGSVGETGLTKVSGTFSR